MKKIVENNLVLRDNSLDFVCGVMIINMILIHTFQFARINLSFCIVLFFFMPWFFFKSGMFFKFNPNMKELICKKSRSLLIPFFWFSLFGELIHYIKLITNNDDNWLHYISFIRSLLLSGAVGCNAPLWFLLSLFIVIILYNVCFTRISFYWLLTISITIAFFTNFYNIRYPLYLGNCSLGLFYYILGHKLSKLQYNIFVFYLAILMLSIIVYFDFSNVDVRANVVTNGHYLSFIFSSIFGIIVINNIIKRLPFILHNNPIYRFVVSIGKDSIIYLVFHFLILVLCESLFKNEFNRYTYLVDP